MSTNGMESWAVDLGTVGAITRPVATVAVLAVPGADELHAEGTCEGTLEPRPRADGTRFTQVRATPLNGRPAAS